MDVQNVPGEAPSPRTEEAEGGQKQSMTSEAGKTRFFSHYVLKKNN